MTVTANRLLLVVAIVLFAIAGMIGAGWVESTISPAFIGFGLAAFAGAHLT